jgi:hypothetical protein
MTREIMRTAPDARAGLGAMVLLKARREDDEKPVYV